VKEGSLRDLACTVVIAHPAARKFMLVVPAAVSAQSTRLLTPRDRGGVSGATPSLKYRPSALHVRRLYRECATLATLVLVSLPVSVRALGWRTRNPREEICVPPPSDATFIRDR